MPQIPYPGVIEKARTRKRYAAKRHRVTVARRQHRKASPSRYLGPTVICVMGSGNTFGAYIRRMLTTRGMTITDLARRSGINRSTISTWINHGPGNITTESVYLIADALGGDRREALATVARDPEIDLILAADWSAERKAAMVERLLKRREEDRAKRLADLEFVLSDDRDDTGEATA